MPLSSDQKQELIRLKESIPGSPEFKRAKKEAIKRSQIDRCYKQYSPPQISGKTTGY